jgi:hypothetical protein
MRKTVCSQWVVILIVFVTNSLYIVNYYFYSISNSKKIIVKYNIKKVATNLTEGFLNR